MRTLKAKAKIGLILVAIGLVFIGISVIFDIKIPITLFGSDGVLPLFRVIGFIFLVPSFPLLTRKTDQRRQDSHKKRRELDLFVDN